MGSLKGLGSEAVGVVTLAAIVLMGIAVVTGFINTLLVENATATAFNTALAIFGTFASILVLAIMGKAVIGLFKTGMN